jgi:hypothetical protein
MYFRMQDINQQPVYKVENSNSQYVLQYALILDDNTCLNANNT